MSMRLLSYLLPWILDQVGVPLPWSSSPHQAEYSVVHYTSKSPEALCLGCGYQAALPNRIPDKIDHSSFEAVRSCLIRAFLLARA